MAKMTDDELRSVVDHEVAESAAWAGSTLAGERERNLGYYHGLPMGNEVEGRSQVVSWDVFEVIESTLPSLLEPFFASEHIGAYEPAKRGDEAYCEQATDYVNYLIKKKNDGFITFNTWIKDGLLSKVGIVRCWWDATRKVRKQTYKGQTDAQLVKFTADQAVTIKAHDAYDDPDDAQHRAEATAHMATLPPEQQAQVQAMLAQPAQQLHDIDVVIDEGPRGACIDNVPPESFILTRGAKKIADVTAIGELRQYTRSDLVEMGYSKAKVEALSDYAAPTMVDGKLSIRDPDAPTTDDSEGALQKLTLFFGFIRCDYDGDGIAEWRRVFMGGNDILENEEVDDHEYCLWSPILLPHRIIGMSYADPVIQVQDTKTALMRQYLDSLYIANNPATQATAGVNLDDLLSTSIGRVVRVKAIGDVAPLQTALVANESLQGIEFMDSVREGRLGVTRYTQGLDADALHKTAAGANQFLSQAQQRLKMTLRIFAETGCKQLMQRMLKLTCTYQDKPATVRLRDEWVEYDPRGWNGDMDVNINVGLGTGDKSENVQFLGAMAPYFAQAATVGVVQPQNVYELGKALMKAGNVQGADKLLSDPSKIPPAPPQKSPEQLLAETELQLEDKRQQGKMAELQHKAQNDSATLEANTALKTMDLQIKDKEVRIAEIGVGLKNMELQHKMALAQHEMALSSKERERKHLDHAPVLEALDHLHSKLDQHAAMETHIVRDDHGRAVKAVKVHPEQLEQEG